jgi:Sel1 repeat
MTRNSLCDWLLKHPNQEPMTPGQQCDPNLTFAANMALRQILMQQHGDSAYVKYDDREFQKQYLNAQFSLGVQYLNGTDVTQNYVTAVQWFRRAADRGHAAAQCNMGFMYVRGHGVTQNLATAVEWYHDAAVQGPDAGQYNLGVMYMNGNGVTQDYARAAKWTVWQLAKALL